MVAPITGRGTKLRLLRGNGAGPEVFTALCALTAKTINFQSNTNDIFVPDCDNPDDPAWRQIIANGKSMSVSGSGTLSLAAHEDFFNDWKGGLSRNYQIQINLPLASKGGHWLGKFMLTTYSLTGEDNALISVELTLDSDGAITWVPAAS